MKLEVLERNSSHMVVLEAGDCVEGVGAVGALGHLLVRSGRPMRSRYASICSGDRELISKECLGLVLRSMDHVGAFGADVAPLIHHVLQP